MDARKAVLVVALRRLAPRTNFFARGNPLTPPEIAADGFKACKQAGVASQGNDLSVEHLANEGNLTGKWGMNFLSGHVD